MSHPNDALRCDFCRNGQVTRRNQEVAFRQWTDRGYVFCQVEIPIGICDRCGSKHWNEDAEALIEQAVRYEYDKLP